MSFQYDHSYERTRKSASFDIFFQVRTEQKNVWHENHVLLVNPGRDNPECRLLRKVPWEISIFSIPKGYTNEVSLEIDFIYHSIYVWNISWNTSWIVFALDFRVNDVFMGALSYFKAQVMRILNVYYCVSRYQ